MRASELHPATATRPGRFGPREWALVAALLVGLVVGFAAAHLLGGTDEPDTATVHSGVVDSLDPGGSVCVRSAGGVTCYQAPGVGLAVGQRIEFQVQAQPVDPADTSKGTQKTIIWAQRP